MANCLVCGKEPPHEDRHVVVLTEAERAQMENPLDEYVYCKPCWGVLSDPVAGPALISGVAQHRLQLLGVPNAQVLASKLRQELMARAVKRRS